MDVYPKVTGSIVCFCFMVAITSMEEKARMVAQGVIKPWVRMENSICGCKGKEVSEVSLSGVKVRNQWCELSRKATSRVPTL